MARNLYSYHDYYILMAQIVENRIILKVKTCFESISYSLYYFYLKEALDGQKDCSHWWGTGRD